ncbi:protein CIP2A [Salarias fasciatus]|uniref:protein CIP2A n=1 Tax=Salarias fasciatus TaxID=181472 RepID=UPI001176A039|nr:protein CIP2A [Salarias fasciatus]
MDMTTCLKSLLLAVHQHRDGGTAQTEAQLLRRVEETSALVCGPLLSSAPLLAAECVSGLVDIAGNPNSSSVLTGSIVSLLSLLAGDDSGREVLHSSFNLSGTLSSIVQRSDPQEPLVLQCLQLLQRLTYNSGVLQWSNSVQQLLSFLLTHIQSQQDVLIVPCLGLMANLCRENRSVQNHIRSLDNVKSFYRTLLNLLDHPSLTVVVFSLSILAGLTLRDKVGDKLFGAENIQQTFQLVFNIMVNGDGTLTRKYSVDLLVDLLKNPKIAECLSRYQHFPVCVTQVLGLLKSKDPQSATKVLELLLSMCRVSSLRPLLCRVVFRPAEPKLGPVGRRPGPEGPDQSSCGLVLVQWLSSPVEGAESCSLQVLQLLKELLEEALGGDLVSDWTLSFVDLLLPVLLDLLRSLESSSGDSDLRRVSSWTTSISSLLLLLCVQDSTRSLLSRQLSAPLCLSQVQALLSCYHSNSPRGSHGDLSVCSEAVLQMVELMSKLRQQVEDMETSFYRTLQDQQMAPPLSLALSSHRRETVHRALGLLSEAASLPDFPSQLLAEIIAANNLFHQKEAELPVKQQEAPPPSTVDQSSSDRGVSCLVEKVQNGLELKDSHVSDIIEVYEQKLSAFSSKEARLQDLLEAKAVAQCQADRLLAQYRLQRAQAEAEARQLASLLKAAERRREELQAELSQQLQLVERSAADTEQLLQHNARLQRRCQETQELQAAYNSLLTRLNDGERLRKELQDKHSSLTRSYQNLKRSQEALQLQHDRLQEELQQQQEEVRTLRCLLQEKSSNISGLQAELRAEEEKVKQKEQQRTELEESLLLLRKELQKTEQARKEASIKASSLELQKTHLEQKLQQKDEDLNKHSAMIAMIHSLSSGRSSNLAL